MVFVFVPPGKPDRKPAPREALAGFLIAGLIALGFIGGIVFLKASKAGSRPPMMILWAIVGLAVILGFIAFFSWLHREAGGDDAAPDHRSQEEQ